MLKFRRDGQRSETEKKQNIKREQNNRLGKSALLTVRVLFRIKNSFKADGNKVPKRFVVGAEKSQEGAE